MGKDWDGDLGGRDYWIPWMTDIMRECLRVMKPGAHGLVWALPRTSHWTATALENAGFEIRDVVTHLFGTGFPKSHNLGNGWGTALKPASEHWILIRRPCSEKTVAANVARWGVGGINVDGCRVKINNFDNIYQKNPHTKNDQGIFKSGGTAGYVVPQGRFPANLVLDDQAAALLDEQSGPCKTGNIKAGTLQGFGGGANCYGEGVVPREYKTDEATGASRFFYTAKASKSERGEGNQHPCVKSLKLMSYLCRLVTPPGGVVLDPFMGSGSTGLAAKAEGFGFIGIEREAEYFKIAEGRLAQKSAD